MDEISVSFRYNLVVLAVEVICEIKVNKYQLFIDTGFVFDVVILCIDVPFVTTLVFPVLENNPPQYPSNANELDNLPKTGTY